MSALTVAEVLDRYDYDPASGLMTWKIPASNNVKTGHAVGSVNSDGYLCTRIRGRNVKVHQLAWAMQNGAWPTAQVDHVNGNRLDNRISNLRLASAAENRHNSRPVNATGFKGVSILRRCKTKPYMAQIEIDGRKRSLGCFPTPEDAARAYDKAAVLAHGQFARLNFPVEIYHG